MPTRSPTALLGTVVSLGLAACVPPAADGPRTELENSAGKADAATVRVRLTAGSPDAELFIRCDLPDGCEGNMAVEVLTPSACELLTGGAECLAGMAAAERELGKVELASDTEGTRTLPLLVSTDDGTFFTNKVANAFSSTTGEEVVFKVSRASSAPDLYIQISAAWGEDPRPGEERRMLEEYLASVPGLTFTETSSVYAGYRAYDLGFEQFVDHTDPSAGTFTQRAQLMHKSADAPMILYTSGYELDADYLSELGETLGANQLSTEQRWFGSSVPAMATAESWRHVTIEQAATDHHRFVEALAPLYAGTWLSTGHSKGGMTSVYHHRFFPNDVDATVAYVAPISFAAPDARYQPFLDQIGERECRENIRAVQRKALEKFDEVYALSRFVVNGETFLREGGPEAAFEKAITWMEWGFWQHDGLDGCTYFSTVPETAEDLWAVVQYYAGVGRSDQSGFGAYEYQSETQLGYQKPATAHLADLMQYANVPSDRMPTGATGAYDPAPMRDIERWVKEEATRILFLYGEYDPWTGGAFDIGSNAALTKVTAPQANHGAMLRGLTEADKKLAFDRIESWIGQRPEPTTPRGAPRPALKRTR